MDNVDKVNKYKSEAQDYILKKYNWDDVVDKTIELYKIWKGKIKCQRKN